MGDKEESEEKQNNSSCCGDSKYNFTGYQELLETLRTKYNEIGETHLTRKKLAEKRLRIILISVTIFVSVVSAFGENGIYPFNYYSSAFIGTLTGLTLTSLLITICFLYKFLTPREMKTLDISEEQWGNPDSRVSKRSEVDNMLDAMAGDLMAAVKYNQDKNNKLGKIYKLSTLGLIIYFLLLSLLIIAITLVNF